MKFMSKKKLDFIIFIICLLTVSFLFIKIENPKNNTHNLKTSAIIAVTISSSEDPVSENTYKVGTELTFSIQDNSYGSVEIQLIGSKYLYTVKMDDKVSLWVGVWNRNDAFPDTYRINVVIDLGDNSANPSEITLVAAEGPTLLIIILVITIIGGIAVSSLIVVKKKRKSKEKDMEFDKVDKLKSKKKGKVYKGASSIGKRSGQIEEAKTGIKTDKDKEGSAEVHKFKEDNKVAGTKKSKKLMPADSGFKFETSAATGAAMMKNMELKLDLDNKVKFTTSKVESILQNIDFFKAILLQQKQEELTCPTCNNKMSDEWIACPYCEIKEYDSELGLQQSMLSLSGEVKFCTNCNRIIKPFWNVCPYCFVEEKI